MVILRWTPIPVQEAYFLLYVSKLFKRVDDWYESFVSDVELTVSLVDGVIVSVAAVSYW